MCLFKLLLDHSIIRHIIPLVVFLYGDLCHAFWLQVVSKTLPADQLISFLDNLFEALLDPHAHSSSGCCVVLNGVIKSRGGELHTEVKFIILCRYYFFYLNQSSCRLPLLVEAVRSMIWSAFVSIKANTSLNTFKKNCRNNTVGIWSI